MKKFKTLDFILSLSIISFIVVVITVPFWSIEREEIKQPNIELPEEYKCISTDENCPNDMVAFMRNDTIILGFKH